MTASATTAGRTRRGMLGLLAAAAAAPLIRPARAGDAFPQMLTVIVAGPEGGRLDDASQPLLQGLGSHLPAGTTLGRRTIGGVDGVTGANQFTAQAAPDGAAALLVPGAASIAWLVGDSRVHFDPSRWLPILAELSPAVVVVRRGLGTFKPGIHLRVASGGADSVTLSAMLALDLLGASVAPVYGLADETAALAALAAGNADAALLRNAATITALVAQPNVGTPLFSFGVPDASGSTQREPALPATPTLVEFATDRGHAPAGPRYAAWRCAASAAQLRYALVLPSLTPPSAVALWRQAGTQAFVAQDGGIQSVGATGAAANSESATETPQVVYAAAAAGLMQSLAPDGTALLDLRGWLATRLGWQAS